MEQQSRTVIVTGGSRGIGAATARLVGRRGYRVCVSYRSRSDAAEAIVAEIAAGGGEAVAIAADLSDEEAVTAVFTAVVERWGRVDALVNNAGTYGEERRVEEMSAAELRTMFDVNVVGCFICAREAIRRMSTRHGGRGGRIVNVSSVAGTNGGSGGRVHYAASKGAINAFTLGLAKEVAGEGITVNAFSPGLTWTDLNPPGRVERLGPTVPIGRAGTAEEMAAGILWLLSDEAAYCVGANLVMSGGR